MNGGGVVFCEGFISKANTIGRREGAEKNTCGTLVKLLRGIAAAHEVSWASAAMKLPPLGW